jgi:hypothetical protein
MRPLRSVSALVRRAMVSRAGHPAGPQHGPCRERLRGFSALERYAFRANLRYHYAGDDFHTQPRKQFLCFRRQILGISSQHTRRTFQQQDARLLRSNLPKIVAQRLSRNLRKRSGKL